MSKLVTDKIDNVYGDGAFSSHMINNSKILELFVFSNKNII